MLRTELLDAVTQVSQLLRESKAHSTLSARSARVGGGVEAIETLRVLSRGEEKLTPAAREILRIFKLEPLFDSNFWGIAISAQGDDARRDAVLEMRLSVRTAISDLPKFAALLSRSADNIEQAVPSQFEESNLRQSTKLTLILPEGDAPSSPKRVTTAIDSITLLYEVVSNIRGKDSNTLALISCDSGSDKVFDFSGLDGVMREVKDLLLGFWDRVVFFRTNRSSFEIDAIGKALPIFDEIEKRREAGVLGPEEAEILKRKLFSATTGIKESGALLREVDYRYVNLDARLLAAPDQKLLLGPDSGVNNQDDPRGEDSVRDDYDDDAEPE